MLIRAWIAELSDLAKLAWVELRLFWVRDVWPVLMTLGIFLVFAAPFLILILILSYLESIGWKADAGFYTIGWSGLDQVQRMQG